MLKVITILIDAKMKFDMFMTKYCKQDLNKLKKFMDID